MLAENQLFLYTYTLIGLSLTSALAVHCLIFFFFKKVLEFHKLYLYICFFFLIFVHFSNLMHTLHFSSIKLEGNCRLVCSSV